MFVRFKELREENELTVEELAKELNIRKELIISIENGYAPVTYIVIAYAKYFNVTSDYLLELSDDKHRCRDDK